MLVPLILLAIVLPFGIGAVLGAPYLPILRRDSEALLKLARLKRGDVFVDIGCGDGRILRAAAARGATCIGYEINPYLVLIARIVTWKYRRRVTIHTANLWETKLPKADIIYFFLLDRFMPRLEAKFMAEIQHPTTVVSYIFQLPTKKPVRQSHNTYVYEFGRVAQSATER